MRTGHLIASGCLAAAVVLSGCAAGGSTADGVSADGRPSIVAAFYPLAYAAERVGGSAVSVTSLTPPGVEPHDLELSAAQVADIASADVVLYIRGFQPAIDEAVDQYAPDRAIDVSEQLALIGGAAEGGDAPDAASDPHVWLDPANMAVIGDTIAAGVIGREPTAEPEVTANAAAFSADMASLDAEFSEGLRSCSSTDLVVSHEAFGYLASAYGMTQVGISGLSPEAEPSPARMRDVADLVRDRGITTIYYETLVDPKVAQTIADETGATTAVLDPLEGLQPDAQGDYVSIMRDNLATLRAGQGCT